MGRSVNIVFKLRDQIYATTAPKVSFQYKDTVTPASEFPPQDDTVSRPSYPENRNTHAWKDGLYIETSPKPQGLLQLNISVGYHNIRNFRETNAAGT